MRVATFFFLSLLLASSPARAQGVNLHWDDCTLGAYQHSKAFLCNTNAGVPYKLVVSVAPEGVIDNVNGAQGYIDIEWDSPVVPDWWRFDAGGCRQGRLSIDVAIGSTSAPFSCPEPWAAGGGGQAGGANFALSPMRGPSFGRITWIVAIPGLTTLDSSIAPDWYIVALDIQQGDTDTCSGCTVGACIALEQVRLTRPAGTPGGDVFIEGPAHTQHAGWQDISALDCPGCPPDGYCPVENVTWGSLKGMFR